MEEVCLCSVVANVTGTRRGSKAKGVGDAFGKGRLQPLYTSSGDIPYV